MKILFGYLSAEYRGGVKFQVDFAQNFRELEVGFLTSNSSVNYEDKVEAIGTIHRIPPTRQFGKRLSALKKLAYEYDILYLNKATLNPFELIMVRMAGFKKVIFHSHSTVKDCKNPVVRTLFYVLHYLSRPFIGLVADKMYACSEEAGLWLFGKAFLKYGEVINNGIEAEKFRYNPDKRRNMREKMGISGFCIMHAGAFSAVKNQGYLVEAFSVFLKKNPDSLLIFAGSGELMKEVKEKTAELGIEEKVWFLGQRNDVCDLMQAADLFVLPSLMEGLPFVVIEAQAAGLPCLVTSGASKQVKITELCDFFDVHRPKEELAELIESKKDSGKKDMLQDIREAGFDLECCARKLEMELMKEVVR